MVTTILLALREWTVAAVGLLIVSSFLPAHARERSTQPGWPCAGTVDPVYVRNAEATGGKVMLFHPAEVAGAAAEFSASRRHDETVLRAGGQFAQGVYEFEVPVDSTIESAYFFVSLQCLETATVVRPSGEELSTDVADVEFHRFEAIRLFVIREPTPGIWKVRIAGRGFFSLIVSAKTDLRLVDVTFLQGDVPVTGEPQRGRPQRLEARLRGIVSEVGFQFISGSAAPIQSLDLRLEKELDADRTYAAEVTPPDEAFRFAVTGIDANGFRYQRVQNRLFITER